MSKLQISDWTSKCCLYLHNHKQHTSTSSHTPYMYRDRGEWLQWEKHKCESFQNRNTSMSRFRFRNTSVSRFRFRNTSVSRSDSETQVWTGLKYQHEPFHQELASSIYLSHPDIHFCNEQRQVKRSKMKAQLFASAALVLLSATPGALSADAHAKVSSFFLLFHWSVTAYCGCCLLAPPSSKETYHSL